MLCVSGFGNPKYCSYSSNDLIRFGVFRRSPASFHCAFSVYPINAGMAVSTEAMDGGRCGISSI